MTGGGVARHAEPRTRRPRLASAFRASPLAVLGLMLVLSPARAGGEEPCADCHDLPAGLAASVHSDFGCVDCHAGADDPEHPDGLIQASCADCHPDAIDELAASAHAFALDEAAGLAAACGGCHGAPHAVLGSADPASPAHPLNLPATCGACHANPKVAERFRFRLVQPIAAYEASVHARGLAVGNGGASCSDCHGSHLIRASADPGSSVHRLALSETCGRCHGEIAETWRGSIHGEAAQHGVEDSPVCVDCHGEHRILSPREPGSPVYSTNIPKMTCGRCHGDLRLAEKFGMSGDKVPAYEDSYHGLATRAGSVTMAHCGSCHGVHDILPSTDPASHVHETRLAETCGQCHPGAGTRFAVGAVHVLPTEREHTAIYWIRWIYRWLIFLTIGGMLLHNGADLWRKARRPELRAAAVAPPAEERMSLAFRIAHGLLAVSFVFLVWTGFALKYPESWWAAPLLAWEASFSFRGWLHRVAAVVMLAAGAWHLVHLAVDRSARACIAGMRPSLADWHELKERIAWFLGRRKTPPAAPRLGYPEKIEYLAVIWGSVVMAVTGIMLWAEDLFLRWAPKWFLDVATTIHFYEAILAGLAILVWHFYFVIFDPWVYPMDPAWLTGRSAPARAAERTEGRR